MLDWADAEGKAAAGFSPQRVVRPRRQLEGSITKQSNPADGIAFDLMCLVAYAMCGLQGKDGLPHRARESVVMMWEVPAAPDCCVSAQAEAD